MAALAGVSAAGGAEAAKAALDPRLKPAAHEFEASLLEELLKPMERDPLFEKDDNSADGSGNALTGFGTEALAKAISDRGGFGIAAKILAHFERMKGSAGNDVGKGDAGKGGAGKDEKIPGIGRDFSTKVSPSSADDLMGGGRA